MSNKRKRLPAYNSEQGRVNSAPTIDEKIARAKKELGLTDKPKSFSDRWSDIVMATRLTLGSPCTM